MRILTTTTAAFGLLAMGGAITMVLPSETMVGTASAAAPTPPSVIRLNGVVRDFNSTTPDFNVTPSTASGHIASLTGTTLGSSGTPTFSGGGNVVTTEPRDAAGNNIAPVMTSYDEGVHFAIVNGQVITSEAFAARITIVGAAMNSGSYEMPVTMKMNVGATALTPFGDYTKAIAGNVNKPGNPRQYTSPTQYAAGTPMYVTGRSWLKKQSSYSGLLESHWQTDFEFNTSSATPQIKVLRNGDTAPNTPGFLTQLAAKQFLLPYIDPVTQKITLHDNEVIYLFELGTTNMSAASADFQDLVVVLTMAKTPAAFNDGIVSLGTGCGPNNDVPGTMNPAITSAGISSVTSFGKWFSDVPGTNLSATTPLDLVRQSDSSYVFDTATDPVYSKLGGFWPADNKMYGTKNSSGHNDSFTFKFEGWFTYTAATAQYFKVLSDAEIWVYIDDKLVIDLGGFHAAMSQRIDLSRLCLVEGSRHKLSFFMANRYAPSSALRIQTNLPFETTAPQTYTITAAGD